MSIPPLPAPPAGLRDELRKVLLRSEEGWFRYHQADGEFVVTIARGDNVRAARLEVDLESVLDWLMDHAAVCISCFPEQSPLRATFSLISIHVEEDLDTGVDPFRHLRKR